LASEQVDAYYPGDLLLIIGYEEIVVDVDQRDRQVEDSSSGGNGIMPMVGIAKPARSAASRR
jgi:hypothetical protein